MQTDFDTLARQAWEAVSAQTGLHADTPVRILRAREGSRGNWRVVARVESATPSVLKFWTQDGAVKASNAFQALEQARSALQPHRHFTVPQPLAWDAQSGAVLMELCKGQVLSEFLGEQSGDNLEDALDPALRWMAALHAGSLARDVPFAGQKKLYALERSARAGKMPEQKLFDACLTQLAVLAAQAVDLPNPSAFVHGDMTLSNILVDGPTVAGIDLNNVTRTSVAIDLAMALCEAVTLYGQDLYAPAFSLLPPEWAAMCDTAYPAMSTDSVNFRFFAGVRLLRMWLKTPCHAEDHSLRRAHIWHGTRKAATRLLLGAT